MTSNGQRGSVLVAGSANIDLVVRVPHIPSPGETVLGRRPAGRAGREGR